MRFFKRWLLVFLALLVPASGRALAQAPAPQAPIVVARLFMDVEGLEAEFPDPAGGWLPRVLEIAEAAEHGHDVIKALRNPDASPIKMALDSVYAVIEAGLREHWQFEILPLETLRGEVHYVFGYPMGNTTRVARTGRYGGALEIDVEVTVPDQVQSSYSIFGTGKVRVKGRPEMRLSVRLVDAGGQKVWHHKAKVRAKEKIVLDERWVLGIRTRTDAPDASSLPALTRQAMDALIQRAQAPRS